MTNSNNPHHPLVLTVLQRVSTDRLQRAVTALTDGSLTVSLTRQTETEIRALVQNGEGKEYGVTLTETGTFCSCADALYRGEICKHATLVALVVLRPSMAQETRVHLTWRKGQPSLCGVVTPARVWFWPYWPEKGWTDTCGHCEAVRKQPILTKAVA